MISSMPKKAKLLYLVDLLRKKTDENHPISTAQIIDYMQELDIAVERKTVYADIDLLIDYGFDIIKEKYKEGNKYYLASDTFEAAEVKLLVDMVQSSRFLTVKKSRALIEKLQTLTNVYEAKALGQTVYVQNRVKAENEGVFYNIDLIHKGIGDNKCISFQYQRYTVDKELQIRKNGARYFVSPYYLICNGDNYYLVAYDNNDNKIKNYRVDRMKTITLEADDRLGKELFSNFDIVKYTDASFSMFGSSDTEKVNLRFSNHLAAVVIDRFGKNVNIHKTDENSFTVSVNVFPSNQFYGWLAGLGNDVKIESPQNIKDEYCQYIRNILNSY